MTPTDTPVLSSDRRERIYRRNFFFFLSDGILFMVGMGMIGSTTVIPDFVRHLTNSEVLIGLSSSLFDIGWTLPQLFIARYIVRSARKKWWFAGPNIPVRFVILIFAAFTVLMGKDHPETVLIAFFIAYGIAGFGDGIVGVPWADLTGTSLNNRWRARMFGLMTASTGVIMLGAAPLIALILAAGQFPDNYAMLFAIAGTLFALSIVPVLFLHELPGGKAVEKVPSLKEFLPDLGRVLRTDAPFRAILGTRLLTSLFMMSSPFYVGFATITLGLSSDVAVPTLLAMQTIGSVVGSLGYTWIGARSNLLFMRLALAGVTLLPISALLSSVVGPVPLYIGFLISGLALSNLNFSYQNWLVGYASADSRPVYVGLFNTIAAVISFASPIIAGTIAQSFGYQPLFVISLGMALAALFVTLRFLRESMTVSEPVVAA